MGGVWGSLGSLARSLTMLVSLRDRNDFAEPLREAPPDTPHASFWRLQRHPGGELVRRQGQG
jgi:hypothetical protein